MLAKQPLQETLSTSSVELSLSDLILNTADILSLLFSYAHFAHLLYRDFVGFIRTCFLNDSVLVCE